MPLPLAGKCVLGNLSHHKKNVLLILIILTKHYSPISIARLGANQAEGVIEFDVSPPPALASIHFSSNRMR